MDYSSLILSSCFEGAEAVLDEWHKRYPMMIGSFINGGKHKHSKDRKKIGGGKIACFNDNADIKRNLFNMSVGVNIILKCSSRVLPRNLTLSDVGMSQQFNETSMEKAIANGGLRKSTFVLVGLVLSWLFIHHEGTFLGSVVSMSGSAVID